MADNSQMNESEMHKVKEGNEKKRKLEDKEENSISPKVIDDILRDITELKKMMQKPTKVFVKKLNVNATIPKKGTPGSAGFDLHACLLDSNIKENEKNKEKEKIYLMVKGGERVVISTGIALEIPIGYYGQIACRSGLALKYKVVHQAGVIDSDYKGEIKVMIHNLGAHAWTINHDDKIAQILFLPILNDVDLVQTNQLSDSERGQNGFGSTG